MTNSTNDIKARMLAIIAAKKAERAALEVAVASTHGAAIPSPVEISEPEKLAPIVNNPFPLIPAPAEMTWNPEQLQAITYGENMRPFCLIGAAGTGKTTTVKEIVRRIMARNQHKVTRATKNIRAGSPAVLMVSFTNRAVKNLKKAVREIPEIMENCLTIHKTLEFAPEYFTIFSEDGTEMNSMRFVPTIHAMNPILDIKLIIVDESSMVSVELFRLLKDGCPNANFIFLGDLNQLPPVFGDAILGFKLAQLPVVELTRVYRQAMDSPIIRFQHEFTLKGKEPADSALVNIGEPGKLDFVPLKSSVGSGEVMARAIAGYMQREFDAGKYMPGEDIILIPYNKSFGSIEMNKSIAQWLGDKRHAIVHEIIGGGFKNYYATEDFVIHNKNEYYIDSIVPNPAYVGPVPRAASHDLLRNGKLKKGADFEEEINLGVNVDIDAIFESMMAEEEVVDKASHIVQLRPVELDPSKDVKSQLITISTRGDLNNLQFGYAITVHKSQGSEWRKVYFVATNSHATMLSRELLYTGMTRAKEHLVMIYSPQSATGKRDSSLARAIRRQVIPGTKWQDKVDYFKGKIENGQDIDC